MKRETKTSTTLDCFMAPKRINSEAISYHEHSDCLETTSLAEEGKSVFQERDHEHLPAEKGSSGLQDTDHEHLP